jgi:hypothetical protein
MVNHTTRGPLFPERSSAHVLMFMGEKAGDDLALHDVIAWVACRCPAFDIDY